MPLTIQTRTAVSTKTIVAVSALAVAVAAAGLITSQFGSRIEQTASAVPVVDATQHPKFVSGQVIVELRDSKDAALLTDPTNTDLTVQSVYAQFGQPNIKPVFQKPNSVESRDQYVQEVQTKFTERTQRGDATVTQHLENFYLLTFSGAVSDDQLAEILAQLSKSDYIQSVSYNNVLYASVIPNDPYFASAGTWGQSYQDLWGLNKIAAPVVWRAGTHGTVNSIVGVVDTGVDVTHPDIVNNIYSNVADIAGNAIDDDGNGYVDDTAGWDFTNSDNNPDDDFFHGTHVAGTIAASGNNAVGVTGVMWAAQILPVKVLGSDGSGSSTDIASGIVYAVDQGVDVVNLSLGGAGEDSVVEAAVQYAHSLGTVVVVAAGNDSEDAMNYSPAMYDEVITVASSSPTDTLSSFSNFGPKIDVTAPGEDILSLLAANGTSAEASDIVGTNYIRLNGTSMATPHVAGAVGLLLQNNPTLSVEEVRQAIRLADDLAARGWDEDTGYGRLNVAQAIAPTTHCEALIMEPDHNAEITDTVTISGYAAGTDFSRYKIRIFEVNGTTVTEKVSSRLVPHAVSNGSLATLTIPDFTPGAHYSIRLSVLDSAKRVCGSDRKEVVGSYVVGSYPTAGYVQNVVRVGNYVYATDGTDGLIILDISTPSNPVLVGTYSSLNSALRVTVDGDYAYVVDGYWGLQIIDISTPSSPTLVGVYDTAGISWGVTVAGNYAYVADYTAGLQIIDISTPASPTLVGTYDTDGYAQSVAVDGSYAYVVDTTGLQIIDISTASNPVLVGTYDNGGCCYSQNVIVEGNYAYVAGYSSGLIILDISTPSSPTLVGNYDGDLTIAQSVAVDGSYAYVADSNNGLLVINIANPILPYLLSTYGTNGDPYGATVQDDLAVVAANTAGIQLVSLTQPMPEHLAVTVGQLDTAGLAYDVVMEGNYAYVADNTAGLQIIDISTPTSPTLVGTYDTVGYAERVTVVGNYAYVDDGIEGLQIIDISTPTSPTLVGNYSISGAANDMTVVGNYAYVAAGTGGFQILDISTPTNLTLVGSYDTTDTADRAYAVSMVDNYAYVANGYSGLQIIDISIPTSPTLVGTYDTSDMAKGVTVEGSYAYVADNTAGLQIIDISTPTSPTLVSNYPTESYTADVAVNGDYAFVADGASGLQIIDISTPASPALVVNDDTAGWALAVEVDGTTAYVADWSGGLLIVELVTP